LGKKREVVKEPVKYDSEVFGRKPLFRDSFVARITNALSVTPTFKENDFTIEYESRNLEENPDNTTSYIHQILISYNYDPYYFIRAEMTVHSEAEHVMIVGVRMKARPGSLLSVDTDLVDSVDAVPAFIETWVKRLADELRAVPVLREFDECKEQIESMSDQLNELPNEYFARAEGEALKAKLEALEKQLIENLQKQVADEELLKKSVDAITNDITALKETIGALTKRGWARSLLVRSFDWMKDPINRKMLKSGGALAKELLLEAGDYLKDKPSS
jgi:polyhydroxyalkanoate synthesis regulator phasin